MSLPKIHKLLNTHDSNIIPEFKTICRFNHTVNNIVHADRTLHVVYIYISIINPLVAAAVACILVHCERVPCVSNAD